MTNPPEADQTVAFHHFVDLSKGFCFGHWIFEFGIYLLFVYCNLVLLNLVLVIWNF
jgi:hypothetical protein